MGIPFKSLSWTKALLHPIMANLLTQGLPVLLAAPIKARRRYLGRSATCRGTISPNTPSQPQKWPTDRPVAVVRTFANVGMVLQDSGCVRLLNMPDLLIRAVRKTFADVSESSLPTA